MEIVSIHDIKCVPGNEITELPMLDLYHSPLTAIPLRLIGKMVIKAAIKFK